MKHRYHRTIALLFVGLLAAQAATGNAVSCLCNDGHAAMDLPNEAPSCCSAERVPPAIPAQGLSTVETLDFGGCDDCIQVPLPSNQHRERELSTDRLSLVDGGLAVPSSDSSLRFFRPSPTGYFCLPPPPSTVIRI